MVYCEGKYCSRKDQCCYHEEFDWKHIRQYLDFSTEGYGYTGIDKDGNRVSCDEYYCGDRSTNFYPHYRALGWREGLDYKNSRGTICDEECVNCEHQDLCIKVLEFAGMIFQPGERIRFDCEMIKADPEGRQRWLDEQLAEWRKQMKITT